MDYRNHNLAAVTALAAVLGVFTSALFNFVTLSRPSISHRAGSHALWAAFGGICVALLVAALVARGRTGPRTRNVVVGLLLAGAALLLFAVLQSLPHVRTPVDVLWALFDHPAAGIAGVGAALFLAWWWWRMSERG